MLKPLCSSGNRKDYMFEGESYGAAALHFFGGESSIGFEF